MAPEPVANCSTINPSAEHFRLSCKPGFDGGMEQFFEVTVRENNSGAVVYNTTTTTDLQLEKLDIKNLSAGMSYIATVSITINFLCTTKVNIAPSLYIPSTLNTDYLLWHTQLIVCAVKIIKSWFKSWVIIFTFQVFWVKKTF